MSVRTEQNATLRRQQQPVRDALFRDRFWVTYRTKSYTSAVPVGLWYWWSWSRLVKVLMSRTTGKGGAMAKNW